MIGSTDYEGRIAYAHERADRLRDVMRASRRRQAQADKGAGRRMSIRAVGLATPRTHRPAV
jgi:hypothetical protein